MAYSVFRRIVVPAVFLILAAAVAVAVIWANPAPDPEVVQPKAGEAEAREARETMEADEEPSPEAEHAGSGAGDFRIILGDGGESPGLLIQFPEPEGWGKEEVPEEEETIAGHWVVEMEGSPYSVTNCHLMLNHSGDIEIPQNYTSVMDITDGEYRWTPGDDAFRADLGILLKSASDSTPVRIALLLVGCVEPSLDAISGSYEAHLAGATPYPYVQRGGFRMHRL